MDRALGVFGGELVLRRDGAHFEIISNGVFLMDTRDGRSEREMVRAAIADLPACRTDIKVLIGGLGVGFSAREALDAPRMAHVTVVELEPRIIQWHGSHLAPVAGRVTDDPRCRVECADIVDWIADAARAGETFDVVCLDTDNGPDWTVVDGNARLYREPVLDQLAAITTPGGVLAFWSAAPAPRFAAVLRDRFGSVRSIEVEVARGEPDVVYLARV